MDNQLAVCIYKAEVRKGGEENFLVDFGSGCVYSHAMFFNWQMASLTLGDTDFPFAVVDTMKCLTAGIVSADSKT